MDEIEKFVEEYIEEMKTDKELVAGEFCVVLYKKRGSGPSETKYVNKIYKTVSDFAEKGVDDIKSIPSDFGVSTECWIYD